MHEQGKGSRLLRSGLLAVALNTVWAAVVTAADPLERVIDQGARRVQDNAAAQQRIDRIADASEDLLARYRAELGIVDGLQTYNRLLVEQVDSQAAERAQLETSLGQVAEIERQILPLMLRMVESLKAFVALDLPFLTSEREQRVRELDALLRDSGVPVAERMRRVLEAYQIEIEYGRTIETFTEVLEIDGRRQQVELLRIGRVALLYRSLDRSRVGRWDPQRRTWQALPIETYASGIDRGIRLARRQAAPDLLLLPVPAPQAAGGRAP